MGTSKILRCACVGMGMLWATAGHAALEDGLVSYWPMDGNFDDARGVNDGAFVGGGTPSFTAGQFGQGIDLNGDDQYVNVGNHPSLNMSLSGPAGNGNVSISAWFRVDSFDTAWQALMSKGEGSNFRIARRDQGSVMSYAGGAGDIPTADLIGPTVNDGLMHHLVAISENGVSTRLWVDGAMVSDVGGAPTVANNDNVDLLIGENPEARGRFWDGLVDDVAIWNRVLDPTEIASLWNGGTGASLGSLIPPSVPGDVTGNGTAGLEDFEVIRMNFFQSVTSRSQGDLDGDGFVDFTDFREWKAHAAGAGVGSNLAVPEPTAYLLVVGMGVGMSLWMRRHRRSGAMPV